MGGRGGADGGDADPEDIEVVLTKMAEAETSDDAARRAQKEKNLKRMMRSASLPNILNKESIELIERTQAIEAVPPSGMERKVSGDVNLLPLTEEQLAKLSSNDLVIPKVSMSRSLKDSENEEHERTAMTLSGVQGLAMARELQKALSMSRGFRKPNITIVGKGEDDDEVPASNTTISGTQAEQLAAELRFALTHPTHGDIDGGLDGDVGEPDRSSNSMPTGVGLSGRRGRGILRNESELSLEGLARRYDTMTKSNGDEEASNIEWKRFKSPLMKRINKEMKEMVRTGRCARIHARALRRTA